LSCRYGRQLVEDFWLELRMRHPWNIWHKLRPGGVSAIADLMVENRLPSVLASIEGILEGHERLLSVGLPVDVDGQVSNIRELRPCRVVLWVGLVQLR
jgi:hypothetical protein